MSEETVFKGSGVQQAVVIERRIGAPRARTLYITYDGVLEPLGESQVLSYLERLTDYDITLLSFEKPEDLKDTQRRTEIWSRLAERRIHWIPLRYHKQPTVLATAWDIGWGLWKGWRAGAGRPLQVVHARGYVPALIALGVRWSRGASFIFDMRGFWADEKVDAGHWKKSSWIYSLAKWWERRFIASADAIVSLTKAGVEALPSLGAKPRSGTPVVVIPTCADLSRFAPGGKDPRLEQALGLEGHTVIGTTGTLSNWYLRQPTLECLGFLVKRLSSAVVLLVTREPQELLKEDALRAGIPEERLVVTQAAFAEMPDYVRLFDLGVFFIQPCFSKKASAATKLAEFLGCGVPVVINDGIGDSGVWVRSRHVGIVLPGTECTVIEGCGERVEALLLDGQRKKRCRQAAEDAFDLEKGSARYAALYRELIDKRAGGSQR